MSRPHVCGSGGEGRELYGSLNWKHDTMPPPLPVVVLPSLPYKSSITEPWLKLKVRVSQSKLTTLNLEIKSC
jgi:hypothetical protein